VSKDGTTAQKIYSDPARDCDERVRLASVFAVLTLMPPELGSSAEPKPTPEPLPTPVLPEPTPTPTKVVTPSPPRPPLAHIELSALLADAPAILDAPELHTFGGELRVTLGRGALSGMLSVAYTARASFELNGVQGDVARLPASAGVRLRFDWGSWVLAGDLGVLAVSQRVRATNLLASRAHHSLELGVRAGFSLEPAGHATLAPLFGEFAWISPEPRDISALPQGVLGNLPCVWLGGALGVSLGL
jgi:hypothetical protein